MQLDLFVVSLGSRLPKVTPCLLIHDDLLFFPRPTCSPCGSSLLCAVAFPYRTSCNQRRNPTQWRGRHFIKFVRVSSCEFYHRSGVYHCKSPIGNVLGQEYRTSKTRVFFSTLHINMARNGGKRSRFYVTVALYRLHEGKRRTENGRARYEEIDIG